MSVTESAFKMRVLGKYSPFPPRGGACPGYYISSGKTGLLLECGAGVLARVQEFMPLLALETVILSHLHFDHMSDLLVLRYAANPEGRYRQLPKKVTVYAPAEPSSEFDLIAYKNAVEARPISAKSSHEIVLGNIKVRFFPVEHPYPCYAMRFESQGHILAYSGDSRPCEGLIEAAKDADVFLCEASCIEEDAEFAKAGHLTARGAGEIAKAAGVKKLLLTHIWPFYDQGQILKECRSAFNKCEIVSEGHEYEIR